MLRNIFIALLLTGIAAELYAKPEAVELNVGGLVQVSRVWGNHNNNAMLSDGQDLWRSDGTIMDTFKVAGHGTGDPRLVGEALVNIFYKVGPVGSPNLWMSDGIANNEELLLASHEVYHVVDFDGFAFFWAASGSGSTLYRTDGTPAGTVVVGGTAGTQETAEGRMLVANNRLVFANQGEVWVSDGTGGGTHQLMTINQGGPANPEIVGESTGHVIFIADDGVNGRQLWRTDGTPAGTARLTSSASDMWAVTAYPVEMTGYIIITIDDGNGQLELWRTDGWVAGTWKLTSLGASGRNINLIPKQRERDNALLYFSVIGTDHELWQTDGSVDGTELIYTMPGDREILAMMPHDGILYMVVYEPSATRNVLWWSNGTDDTTELLRDVGPDPLALKDFAGSWSGRLMLWLDSGGVTPLWIMDTDGHIGPQPPPPPGSGSSGSSGGGGGCVALGGLPLMPGALVLLALGAVRGRRRARL